MKISKMVHGHTVVFKTHRLVGPTITVDGELFLDFDDSLGFGRSFFSRFGKLVFDLTVEYLERFYARGGRTYMDIPDTEIPDHLQDFMNSGGTVDGFNRLFNAWNRSNSGV